MSFVELEDVCKEYPTALALRGVSLRVEKGQWVSVMGPSGSGKTTLLNIIGGLDTPTRGSVRINAVNVAHLSEDDLARFRRETIGCIFQRSHLVPHLDAVENVMLAQYFHSMADEDEAKGALRRVGLGHRLAHRPAQLSAGEQQRVCIARALINNPAVLLADEPTGNLDKENTRIVLELLKDLHSRERFTIILVTHDPFVSQRAQRIVKMEDGTIAEDTVG